VNLKAVKGDNTIKTLAADFDVRDGKLNLKKPMTATVDGNKVVLKGAIGIAGKLFLEGGYFVSPSLADKATAGKCKSEEEFEVPLTIGGTIDKPDFRPNGGAAAASLAQRCLKGAAGQALSKAAKEKLGVDLPLDKAAAEAKSRAEADRLKAEAEQRAKAEAEKARAEAEAKIQQARLEAEQKARAEAEARVQQAKLEAEKRAREETERKRREAEEAAKKAAGDKLKGLFGGK
jgi:flagellar biosynthesis GTPase FlhF